MAIQTNGNRWHTGTGPSLCPYMATLARHIHFIGIGVSCVQKGNHLFHFYHTWHIRMAIYQHKSEHPHYRKEAEGVH